MFQVDTRPHPPLGLIDLSGGGSIVGLAGAAVSHDSRLLRDVSWFDLRKLPERTPRSRYPTEHLGGTCLSIAADCAHDNYGHFLLDALPRLGLAQAAGRDAATFDRLVCAPLPQGIPAWLLERAGLHPDRMVVARLNRRITAERLFATTFPGRPRDYPGSTVRYLRSLLPAGGKPPGRRLFVRRFGKRAIVNENELLEIAARHGFEPYDFRTSASPPHDFAEARIVAGAHSATLANIAFCAPDMRLFEIVPSDHIEPYYMTLARAAGLEYHYMVGASETQRPVGSLGPSHSPVRVDPAVFQMALQALVELDGSEP